MSKHTVAIYPTEVGDVCGVKVNAQNDTEVWLLLNAAPDLYEAAVMALDTMFSGAPAAKALRAAIAKVDGK